MVLFTPAPRLNRKPESWRFGYLLRYEHIIGDNEDIQEVRCIFVELPAGPVPVHRPLDPKAAHPLRHLRRNRDP